MHTLWSSSSVICIKLEAWDSHAGCSLAACVASPESSVASTFTSIEPSTCGGDTLIINPFIPTVPTFAVRETDVSRHNGGTSGAPLKPLRVDSTLRALSSLRGLRGAPEVPPLCRETQSLGQQMLERWAWMALLIAYMMAWQIQIIEWNTKTVLVTRNPMSTHESTIIKYKS